MRLIGGVRDDERRQLIAGQAGECPGAQGQPMRGGYGFRAEVLIEQYRQGGEAAAVSGVDEEQHHQHGPQQSAVDTVSANLQQAYGDRYHENHLIYGFAALEVIGQRGEAHAAGGVEHGIHGEHQTDNAGNGGRERARA